MSQTADWIDNQTGFSLDVYSFWPVAQWQFELQVGLVEAEAMSPL